MSEQDDTAKAPEVVNNVVIEFDGKKFTVVVPVVVGKLGVYGAFQVAQEMASKVFWGIEKKQAEEEEKSKSLLSRLHIPGVRTH